MKRKHSLSIKIASIDVVLLVVALRFIWLTSWVDAITEGGPANFLAFDLRRGPVQLEYRSTES